MWSTRDLGRQKVGGRSVMEVSGKRAQLLQAHGVLTCLYEVLLHADGEQAVQYAQAAYVAASLINKGAEELDSVRIWPLIETLASSSDRVDESRDLYVN